ncbi:adenylate/guanylate cyclase domain-containing protein [Mycobacterium marinum]|uniref:adenylate/guanylate cyclase domain-containing protein n=1 Tax=Mycobacterium marinum TaxID=1781 RepID=UPI00233FD406|nr:adenylate/guanylate cyclase domain-containing protein [Mycobacterium marinum]MDC8996859.1 adenylate/guanylate cyclase domain-containing protein [Mycobacterium marinum]WDZ13114.1 adenylate/guanylate cyclase domain-containing protein [Mycobacterium marinum]
MERVWQWAWDRCGARYSWAICVVTFAVVLPVYLLLSFWVVAFENSGHYIEAAVVTVAVVSLGLWVIFLPSVVRRRLPEKWAADHDVDRLSALEATYVYGRGAVVRGLGSNVVLGALNLVAVGAVAGASGSRLVQYGIVGAATGIGIQLIAIHSFVEAALRPARVAIIGDTAIGDSLPRSRPTFAAWSNLSVFGVAFNFAIVGAMLAGLISQAHTVPLVSLVIGAGMAVVFGVPVIVAPSFSPSMQPIRDLAAGTERVAAGDYSRRLPVVQDDDLGALAASFNHMQAGLVERQRLQAAFGTYVDPGLAARLLEQGDDVFTGERRQVTVMFVDVRDFTPFAEAHTAEDTVSRLNELFEIVVPTVVDAGGHVNKFLGDGALAVFGAPNDLADHADAAVAAAVLIHGRVVERFGEEFRIGIGINTGVVIAGTIGGGGKLEFTLIGDTVNVAARVEQLTKATGDAILLTQQCVDAQGSRPAGLIDRGLHVLKGKSAAIQVFGLHQESDMRADLTH